jgi:hypothetical protein
MREMMLSPQVRMQRYKDGKIKIRCAGCLTHEMTEEEIRKLHWLLNPKPGVMRKNGAWNKKLGMPYVFDDIED